MFSTYKQLSLIQNSFDWCILVKFTYRIHHLRWDFLQTTVRPLRDVTDPLVVTSKFSLLVFPIWTGLGINNSLPSIKYLSISVTQ